MSDSYFPIVDQTAFKVHNTTMRRILAVSLFLASFLPGCRQAPAGTDPLASIKTYRDIPGVTQAEISAIEALRASRDKISYGTLASTEAFITNNGSHAGFAIMFCRLLSDLFEINFVNEIYEWDELITQLEGRSLDFIAELTPTEERMQRYLMTYPIAERFLRIFRHVDSAGISAEMDIRGLRVGFLEGSITAETIKKTYPFLAFTSVEVADYGPAAMMIANGEIDAFIGEAPADPVFDEYDFIHSFVAFPMIHEPISMTSANPEMAPVISVINKYITAGGVDKLYDLYKEGDVEYAQHKLRRSLNDEERTYIAELQVRRAAIPVAYEFDNYPVIFYNENEKQFQGIARDVLSEIGKLLDIEFTAATEKDTIWAETYRDLQTGKVPMTAELLQTEARRDYFIWSAVPYSSSDYAILSRMDFPNLASYQVVRYKVGVVRQSANQDLYRELFPSYNNLVEYNSVEECLDALENGEVDLLMASDHMLIMQTHYREKPGLKINLRLSEALDSYFGFNKNEQLLCSIIDKAQAFVQTDIIVTGWTDRTFDYSKKLAEQRAVFLTGFVSVLSLLLIATIVLLARVFKLSKTLKDVASHDALTGILNRRYFMELGTPQIDRSSRQNRECFMAMFDLDHFKLVNDTYGHQAGDKVLKEIAQRIKSSIRLYDLFGRYGGEEFVLLMFDTDKENALNVAERLRLEVCKAPIDYEGKHIAISASFGITEVAPFSNIETAIKCADDALYQAKETGRNKVVFYENDNLDIPADDVEENA